MDSRLERYSTSLEKISQKRIVQQRKEKPYDTSRYDAYLTMLPNLLDMTVKKFDCVPVDFSLFCRKIFESMGPLTTKIFQNIPPRKLSFTRRIISIMYGLFYRQQMQTRQVQGFLRGRVYQNVTPMTEKQLRQLKIPEHVKKDMKKSINAASISQVLHYGSIQPSSPSSASFIIKVIRPSSRERFQHEVEVVINTVLPTVPETNKSVRRFIQALIDDVENEMNLKKEAENMKTAKSNIEQYSKYLGQQTQQMKRDVLDPFSQMLKLDECAAAKIIRSMYSSSKPPEDIKNTLDKWSGQCSNGNEQSTPPQQVQQRQAQQQFQRLKNDYNLGPKFLEIFPDGYDMKNTKGTQINGTSSNIFLLTKKNQQGLNKSMVKLFSNKVDFDSQKLFLSHLPKSSKVYFPQRLPSELEQSVALNMQNRFDKATVLQDWLERSSLTTTQINTMARNLISAVTTMNKDGIFFGGDINPKNIIVSPNLDIQFIDAGSITIVTPAHLLKHREQEEQYTKKNNFRDNLFLIPNVRDGEYDQNYIIMERVIGITLAKLLEKGSITLVHYQCLENLVRTYVGFINTLYSYKYIFHADLHPGNIMFSTSVQKTTMTIIDWGRVVKIEDNDAKSSARILLLFYKLRQDYLEREDELLLVCRMFAPLQLNAEYYFYWLDKFYVPRQQDLDIDFKFSNIYRWLQELERLVNEIKERILKVMTERDHTYYYKSFLSTDPHYVKPFINNPTIDDYDLLEVKFYMQQVYLFIRSCFQYDSSNDVEKKLKHFLDTTIDPEVQVELNNLLRGGDNILKKGKKYLEKQDGITFYKQILCALFNPLNAEIDVTSCLTPHKCHVGTMFGKYIRKKRWYEDVEKVFEHFKIKLPDSQTFNSHTYKPKVLDLDLTQQAIQEIDRTWTSALDLKKAIDDKSLYPLSTTSTFMRIFDAFQRLEQTLQITWDKVSTVQKLGSKKKTPPVITDFLTLT